MTRPRGPRSWLAALLGLGMASFEKALATAGDLFPRELRRQLEFALVAWRT